MAKSIPSHYMSNYFIEFVPKDREPSEVLIACVSDTSPPFLKNHTIYVLEKSEDVEGTDLPSTFQDWMDISPTLSKFSDLEWRGKIRGTYQTVNSMAELKELLQNSSEDYCVWGKEQVDFYEPLVKEVIDISFEFLRSSLSKILHDDDSNS
ncbi:hypothetical protein AVEN_38386-1 [Araneus ventricosus]|uniref:Uncharacterized protein n=1 Tax=Araneus ventricosus TaxID=182803 RepID=A0A4Y2SQ84_ARAVE|nr:hypothetical protein AVEN_38386-1 [Araneus ventricosus]